MPLQKKKTAIDFGDEEAVLADVAAVAFELRGSTGGVTEYRGIVPVRK